MKKSAFIILFMSLFICGQSQIINGFKGKKTRILFLLDGSGSMLAEMDESNRWSVAVTLMSKIVDTLRTVPNVEVGLRVFGHNKPNELRDCNDTRLEVPFSPYNHKQFVGRLRQIKPLGYTSITQSLLASAKDFPEDKTARNIIIIITDGVEECGGDPCKVSEQLQKKGIVLKPFIIGLGTDNEIFRNAYSCAGKYYNAENSVEFEKIIGVIVNQALNNTTVQLNMLDAQGLPRETDMPITLYDANNGVILENFIHTMNGKGIPDTLYLDPMQDYKVVAHTLPPVVLDKFEITPGRHNTIPLNTPQGNLLFKMGGVNGYNRLLAIVRKNGTYETVNVQDFNTTKRYITGSYDVEILCTPRIKYNNISVKQSQTTTIEIPAPGLVQLNISRDVTASVFQKIEGKMIWVMDFNSSQPKQLHSLQPGEYIVVYRPKSETRTLYTKKKEFKVQSGINTQLSL